MSSNLLRKTPLAWRQLMKEKTRLAVAVAGIAFADMLMFLQMGFEGALYDASIKPHRSLQSDLVLISPQFQALISVKNFSRDILYKASSHESVKSVNYLYINTGQWRNPETRTERAILVWGIDPSQSPFNIPEIAANQDKLKQLNTVLFDEAGRAEYGEVSKIFKATGKLDTELSSKAIRVGGLFQNGASFAADGNVVMSHSTYLQMFNSNKPDQISVGLINLKPGADKEKVRAELEKFLPKDVKVLTIEGFAQIEKKYWEAGTSIGFIFGLGVGVGFIVGIVIVYQILYSDVSDHLPEYATLKAMGYTDLYLLGVLFQESIFLAVLGFVPGLALSMGLYQLTQAATMLPIAMNVQRAFTVWLMTLIMCTFSGTIAMRKLSSADPAEIF
ncbi:MAG TPA: ABC transporter permease DevC [Nostocaceae cyanobacterium]|nr:ABC transporter permease DevC [Nostocaceae cyanobacterium]